MGLFLVVGHGTAIAQENDDDEDTFEQKIIKGVLGGIGLDVGRAGIDYSEGRRSLFPQVPTCRRLKPRPPPRLTGPKRHIERSQPRRRNSMRTHRSDRLMSSTQPPRQRK